MESRAPLIQSIHKNDKFYYCISKYMVYSCLIADLLIEIQGKIFTSQKKNWNALALSVCIKTENLRPFFSQKALYKLRNENTTTKNK